MHKTLSRSHVGLSTSELHKCWEQNHTVYVSHLILVIQITCFTPASVHNKFILCEEKLAINEKFQ